MHFTFKSSSKLGIYYKKHEKLNFWYIFGLKSKMQGNEKGLPFPSRIVSINGQSTDNNNHKQMKLLLAQRPCNIGVVKLQNDSVCAVSTSHFSYVMFFTANNNEGV